MAGEPGVNDVAFEIEFKGKTHVLRLADYTGEDDKLCYQNTGFSVFDIFVNEKISTFTMAALLWLELRKADRTLKYETVNKHFTTGDLMTLRDVAADNANGEPPAEDSEPSGPEA